MCSTQSSTIYMGTKIIKKLEFKNPDIFMCDKIFFFFYFLQQILNKIDYYTPGMFPYNDEENDWLSRT